MIIVDRPLSQHFLLSEFVRSETAARQGIDNTPPPEVILNLIRLAARLERVRALLGVPLHISSGYRCLELNRAIGSSDTSRHVRGLAADFQAPAFGTPLEVCRRIADQAYRYDAADPNKASYDLAWDQLIYEHTWAHFGLALIEGPTARFEVLTLMQGGTYAHGLVVDKGATP